MDEKTDINQMNEITSDFLSQANKNPTEHTDSTFNQTIDQIDEALINSPDETSWQSSTSPCSSESIASFSSNSQNDLKIFLENSTNQRSLSSPDRLSDYLPIDDNLPSTMMNILSIPNHFENTLDSLGFMNYYASSELDSQIINQNQFNQSSSSPLPRSIDNFSCISSPNELDHKSIDSTDLAWMDTLDVSGLDMDDVAQIFSTANSLKSTSEEMQKFEHCTTTSSSSSSSSRKHHSNLKNNQRLPTIENCTLKQNSTFNENVDEIFFPNEKNNDEHHSDSTLTCSEAEYYNNLIRLKRLRKRRKTKRKSKHRSFVGHDESDLSSCDIDEDDDREEEEEEEKAEPEAEAEEEKLNSRFEKKYNLHNRTKTSSQNHSHSSDDINECKSWWPNPITRRMHKDFQSTLWSTNELFDCQYKPLNTDQLSMSISTKMEAFHDTTDSNEFKTSWGHRIKCKNLRRQKISQHPLLMLTTNSDKQQLQQKNKPKMELWQFILYRLEKMSKHSAFQWVNKTIGVFRIVNTHLAAQEWGHYRNNQLMDYEKMARAMRFYYKDSILRKSRQQLHFQFAMPYVKWAEKFYRNYE
ncbi:unnamed protein product [Schistosoma turkestanicum]|nr:unnamed protein product [Schistosoma turkestanicum]